MIQVLNAMPEHAAFVASLDKTIKVDYYWQLNALLPVEKRWAIVPHSPVKNRFLHYTEEALIILFNPTTLVSLKKNGFQSLPKL